MPDSVTPWTATYQAPPIMGFSRQEYWSALPLPSPVYVCILHVYYICMCIIYVYYMYIYIYIAQLCPTLCKPMDYSPPGSPVHGIFSSKNTGVGCHFLFQGIFPTHGWNSGLPHCRQTPYHLSHQRIPYIYIYISHHMVLVVKR